VPAIYTDILVLMYRRYISIS